MPLQVIEARETEVRINEARNVYRGVAARGAQLFFLLNSLSKMHAFYQYSLNSFVVSVKWCEGWGQGSRMSRMQKWGAEQRQPAASGWPCMIAHMHVETGRQQMSRWMCTWDCLLGKLASHTAVLNTCSCPDPVPPCMTFSPDRTSLSAALTLHLAAAARRQRPSHTPRSQTSYAARRSRQASSTRCWRWHAAPHRMGYDPATWATDEPRGCQFWAKALPPPLLVCQCLGRPPLQLPTADCRCLAAQKTPLATTVRVTTGMAQEKQPRRSHLRR